MRSDPTAAFDAMAASYDELEPWYEHLYAVLGGLLRRALPPGGAGERRLALDAGCGTGFQTALLLALGYRAAGIDLSPGLLAVARRRHRGARFVRGDLQALPWRDGAFDVAVSCGSTLSFVEDPARALGELGRVLRPGGHLVLEVERRWTLDLAWRLASALAGDRLGYGATPAEARQALARPLGRGIWIAYPGYPPLRLFTRRELDGFLARAGLVPVRAWGIHGATNLIPSTILHRPRLGARLARVYAGLRRLDRALAGTVLGRATGNSLVVLARKAAAAGPPPGVGPARPGYPSRPPSAPPALDAPAQEGA
ncbi:MAG TPA: class I SAM-dependent methyltransferase [Methylomirabilota bacterium]|nr:class I SAM-dependent methyltransferase [Methylomirabilota bacterium]